ALGEVVGARNAILNSGEICDLWRRRRLAERGDVQLHTGGGKQSRRAAYPAPPSIKGLVEPGTNGTDKYLVVIAEEKPEAQARLRPDVGHGAIARTSNKLRVTS